MGEEQGSGQKQRAAAGPTVVVAVSGGVFGVGVNVTWMRRFVCACGVNVNAINNVIVNATFVRVVWSGCECECEWDVFACGMMRCRSVRAFFFFFCLLTLVRFFPCLALRTCFSCSFHLAHVLAECGCQTRVLTQRERRVSCLSLTLSHSLFVFYIFLRTHFGNSSCQNSCSKT